MKVKVDFKNNQVILISENRLEDEGLRCISAGKGKASFFFYPPPDDDCIASYPFELEDNLNKLWAHERLTYSEIERELDF